MKQRISNIKENVAENTQSEQQKEKTINENTVRGLWDNIKYNNICIMGHQKKRESKGLGTYLKKITENFPNLVKKKYTQVQEAQRVPNNMTQRGPHQDI